MHLATGQCLNHTLSSTRQRLMGCGQTKGRFSVQVHLWCSVCQLWMNFKCSSLIKKTMAQSVKSAVELQQVINRCHHHYAPRWLECFSSCQAVRCSSIHGSLSQCTWRQGSLCKTWVILTSSLDNAQAWMHLRLLHKLGARNACTKHKIFTA